VVGKDPEVNDLVDDVREITRAITGAGAEQDDEAVVDRPGCARADGHARAGHSLHDRSHRRDLTGNPGGLPGVEAIARMRSALRFTVLLALLFGCSKQIGDACVVPTDCSTAGDRDCSDPTAAGGYCTIRGCDYNTCPSEAVCG